LACRLPMGSRPRNSSRRSTRSSLHSTHLRTPNVRGDRGGKGLRGAGARVLASSQRDQPFTKNAKFPLVAQRLANDCLWLARPALALGRSTSWGHRRAGGQRQWTRKKRTDSLARRRQDAHISGALALTVLHVRRTASSQRSWMTMAGSTSPAGVCYRQSRVCARARSSGGVRLDGCRRRVARPRFPAH
jgi:hypothetical protein